MSAQLPAPAPAVLLNPRWYPLFFVQMPLFYTEIELAREVFALGVYTGFIRMITPNPPVWPPPEPVIDSQGQSQGQRPTFQGPTTLIGTIVFRTSAQHEAALVRLEGHLNVSLELFGEICKLASVCRYARHQISISKIHHKGNLKQASNL